MSRRRQANGCPHRVNVSLTDGQYEKWKTAADGDSVSLQRWLVDRVEGRPPTMITRALVSEVKGIRLEASGAFSNLNQIAHRAHYDGIDLRGWFAALVRVARVVGATEQWIADHQ